MEKLNIEKLKVLELKDKKDYKFINGNIYTGNANNDFVNSLIIKENKIVFVGNIDEAHSYLKLNKVDSYQIEYFNFNNENNNHLILPGFVDSHVHPIFGGMSQESEDLSECEDVENLVVKLSEYLKNNPNTSFISGIGYNDTIFKSDTPIHFSILDKVSKDIPICVTRSDLHAYWCNSALIKSAGITEDIQDPEGGVIEKDSNNKITGVFHDSAMSLLKNGFPKYSVEDKIKILKEVMKHFISLGITSFMDAATSPSNFKIYKTLYVDKKLNEFPRCSLSISAKNVFLDKENDIEIENELTQSTKSLITNENVLKLEKFFNINRIEEWEETNYKFRVNSVKLFIDGVFESGTAMFTKCNCNASKNEEEHKEDKKCYTYNDDELQSIIDYLYSNNIQIHSHCIGDLATQMVIDSIQKSKIKYTKLNKNFINVHNNYLAHLQLVGYEEIKKMKDLNICANMTPYWFMADSFTPILHSLIGDERINEIYPIRHMMNNDILIGFGSDWPVSTLNPLEGIEVAITHRGLGETPDKPTYNSEHLISIYEAVKCYTLTSAQIIGLEKVTGSLEVGKFADLVVLDKNIFKIPPWKIHKSNVIMTMIDGEFIYTSLK